jgi:hypothetical protein
MKKCWYVNFIVTSRIFFFFTVTKFQARLVDTTDSLFFPVMYFQRSFEDEFESLVNITFWAEVDITEHEKLLKEKEGVSNK